MRRYSPSSCSGMPRLALFPVGVLWMELIFKWWTLGNPFGGLLFTALFSLAAGLLICFAASLFSARVNRILSVVLLGALTLWFMASSVYFTIFKSFPALDSLSMAGEAIGTYWRETLTGIAATLPALTALSIPLLVLLLFLLAPTGRRAAAVMDTCSRRASALLLAAAMLAHFLCILCISLMGGGVMSPAEIYRGDVIYDLSVSKFGLLTTLRLDVSRRLFPLPEAQPEPELPDTPDNPNSPEAPDIPDSSDTPEVPDSPAVITGDNVLAIDFDALAQSADSKTIKAIDEWVASRTPTAKNEYTGMFAGKNLIFITAEAFWKYAVDEQLTPTLYKLANESFVFENFYNPLWWHSTIDGEYCHCTGLIPSNQVFAFRTSANNSMPFCMGNMLRAQGYDTRAYHNNTYTYYDRDKSHPNMGYDYIGVGNGLEVTNTWPQSDLEMMQQTIPQALESGKPFHNYYMTVSGHMNYSFTGNMMSYVHRDKVAHLDMSEEARAYLACNIEFDLAMEYVLEQLEKAGQLENTVICISGDHYPYGMDPATWDELCGGQMNTTFDIFRSTLILWSGSIKQPISITKPCCSMDVLPTLLNLFGLEYDSRLLAGQDILSDAPGLVVLSNRSFITEFGRYDAKKDKFTPYEGITVNDGYASAIYQKVSALFKHSGNILIHDYYGTLEDRIPGGAPWQK